MSISGIYSIINNVNGKMYIGQSLDVKARIRCHRYQLKKGIHGNNYLLSSYNVHGAASFSYEIIYTIEDQTITKEQILHILNEKEQHYINKYESFDKGYNLTSGGENIIFSEETIEKMRKSHIGQKPSIRCRQMASERMKNRVVSEETKKRLSKAMKGKTHSDESKRKMSKSRMGFNNNRYGTHHSEETKHKIGGAQIGELNHNYGKTTPDNVKQKCRDSYHGA